MKLYYSLIFSFFLFSSTLAQDNFKRHFFSFHAGYSVPVSSSQIGSPRTEIGKTFLSSQMSSEGYKFSEKNSYNSRGAGLNFSLSYGYMFTDNFSAEIDFSYVSTFEIIDASILNTRIKSDQTLDTSYYAIEKSNTSMFRATPMIGVYANPIGKFRPFAKFGIIIPFAGSTKASLYIDDKTGEAFNGLMPIIDRELFDTINSLPISIPIPTKSSIEAESFGSFSLGFDARVGTEFIINDNFNLFFEMNMQMLTVKTDKTVITKFYSDTDEDSKKLAESILQIEVKPYQLEDIPEHLRVTQYQDEITEESNIYTKDELFNYDKDKPGDQLNFRNNYNAFGFLLGLKFSF